MKFRTLYDTFILEKNGERISNVKAFTHDFKYFNYTTYDNKEISVEIDDMRSENDEINYWLYVKSQNNLYKITLAFQNAD